MNDEKKRILLVEDEVIVAMTIEESLIHLGYEVVGTVDDGLLAIDAAEKENPDLILMDIRIHGDLDGIETIEKIKENIENKNIPVIFLTAHSDEETLSRMQKISPSGVLIKPFREIELSEYIESALARYRTMHT